MRLIFTAYVLRRIINLIGVEKLESYLRELLAIFLVWIKALKRKIPQFKALNFLNLIKSCKLSNQQKGLYSLKNNPTNIKIMIFEGF